MPNLYNGVQGNNPPKNLFDLSYSHFLTMKVGKLYPIMCKEVYAGDVFKMSEAVHAELQPMVAPLLSDLNLYVHTFFVPFRLLYGFDGDTGKSIWEQFITGGDDGDYDTPLKSWKPEFTASGFSSDTIWDSVGFPVKLTTVAAHDDVPTSYSWSPIVPKDLNVSIAPKYAYNLIWNEFYRDENLQEEIDLENEYLLYRDWRKDYFTSSLESQQFGTAPALPIAFNVPSGSPIGYFDVFGNNGLFPSKSSDIWKFVPAPTQNGTARWVHDSKSFTADPSSVNADGFVTSFDLKLNGKSNADFKADGLHDNTYYDKQSFPLSYTFNSAADFNEPYSFDYVNRELNVRSSMSVYSDGNFANSLNSHALTFNVADMRLVFAIQRLQELSMRGGHRYTEYLQAHYGASPTDARLDRPEYIGGCMFPINVGVSVQTSESAATPQGNKVGIGNINDIMEIGSYRVEEYGLIMSVASIVPKPCYTQGINREWLRQTRFNYYHPEFANISEQGVYRAELYVDPSDTVNPDNGIFGYQGAWNELRASQNIATGAMREQFDYWLMSRKFKSRPALNSDFITLGHPDEYNRVWAVQDEDQFIVAFSNIIEAYRPIPAYSVPGLIDHVYGNM